MQTVIKHYLIIIEVFLKSDEFGIPPPLVKFIPVVSSNDSTTGRILYTLCDMIDSWDRRSLSL